MPVGPGRYRTLPNGVRLHFTTGGTVNEAKNTKTGAVHTPAEFKADAKKDKKSWQDHLQEGMAARGRKG
jgi:hypothetical protein